MRIDLNEKATARALDASGPTGRSPAALTNLLWENLEAVEVTQIVTMRFKITDPSGKVRRRVVKKISTTRWATNY